MERKDVDSWRLANIKWHKISNKARGARRHANTARGWFAKIIMARTLLVLMKVRCHNVDSSQRIICRCSLFSHKLTITSRAGLSVCLSVAQSIYLCVCLSHSNTNALALFRRDFCFCFFFSLIFLNPIVARGIFHRLSVWDVALLLPSVNVCFLQRIPLSPGFLSSSDGSSSPQASSLLLRLEYHSKNEGRRDCFRWEKSDIDERGGIWSYSLPLLFPVSFSLIVCWSLTQINRSRFFCLSLFIKFTFLLCSSLLLFSLARPSLPTSFT